MDLALESFPLRERGLKPGFIESRYQTSVVVPLAGTWIETCQIRYFVQSDLVVPLAGTWIETRKYCVIEPESGKSFPLRERGLKPFIDCYSVTHNLSFPLRERGLKHMMHSGRLGIFLVVPLAGTWIETPPKRCYHPASRCRSPCGNVD